jgi:hypothetical protein
VPPDPAVGEEAQLSDRSERRDDPSGTCLGIEGSA